MPKCQRPPIHDDPHVLLAVAEFRAGGLSWRDACRRLRISKWTYYQCVASIEARRASPIHDDDED